MKRAKTKQREQRMLIADAMRYRKLRFIAMELGDLECFVACEALDHQRDYRSFDAEVDAFPAAEKHLGARKAIVRRLVRGDFAEDILNLVLRK